MVLQSANPLVFIYTTFYLEWNFISFEFHAYRFLVPLLSSESCTGFKSYSFVLMSSGIVSDRDMFASLIAVPLLKIFTYPVTRHAYVIFCIALEICFTDILDLLVFGSLSWSLHTSKSV